MPFVKGYLEAVPVDPGGPPIEPPLGIWGGGNEPFPTPPIYIIIPPDIVNGKPTHPIFFPIYPAHPIVLPPGIIDPGPPPVPAHPIVLPPEIWPSPGHPAHPIVLPPGIISPGPPPVPAHPIYFPPLIWGGSNEPFPEHPIVIPPPPTDPPPEDWSWGYTVRYGWVAVPPYPGKPRPPHPAEPG